MCRRNAETSVACLLLTAARSKVTLWTSVRILAHRSFHVYPADARQAEKPCRYVGKFLPSRLPVPSLHCPCQLPNFLDEPEKSPLHSAALVFIEINALDLCLKLT